MSITVIRDPFPHAVIDAWFDTAYLADVLDEFPEVEHYGWRRYQNSTERKLEGPRSMWGSWTKDYFVELSNSVMDLEQAFGIDGLHLETIGGGYHCIEPGGYLGVHADFNRSSETGRYRRLNVITYLNRDWDDDGGHLELWNDAERVADIIPEFGRTVIFETSSKSWHGHPKPAQRIRKSVAGYFFTDSAPVGYTGDHSTVWHPHARIGA